MALFQQPASERSVRFFLVGLTIVFLVLIAIVLGLGQFVLDAMASLHADARNIADQQWVDVRVASQALQYSTQNIEINTLLLISHNPSGDDPLVARRAINSAKISDLLEQLSRRVNSSEEQRALNAVLRARALYMESHRRVTSQLSDHREKALELFRTETWSRMVEYQSAFSDYLSFQTRDMTAAVERGAVKNATARRSMAYLVACSVLLILIIAALVISKITIEIHRRETAESNLRKLNQELEGKVVQRSLALQESCALLEGEIAERRRSEELAGRLSVAVEQCPVSIVITDLSGQITYVNRKFVDCTGYSREEAIGQNPRILKSGITSSADYDKLWSTITDGKEWRGEFHNKRKNGEIFVESAVIRPIGDENGNVTHYLAVKEDITERVALQMRLQQAEKLESIGQLAAGIAHEINTPMQFVGDNVRFLQDSWASIQRSLESLSAPQTSSFAEPALRHVSELLEESELKYLQQEIPLALEQSIEGVKRVTEIVLAMKEFSHPGSEEKQPADLNHAIETAVTVSRNEWKHVAELEQSLSETVGLVPCYIGELKQVLLNLIVNAAHAIGQVQCVKGKGKITIRTAREQNYVQISIQDTGCGIPLGIQSRIFDPFFTTKEPGKGTGQGLALAYAIIVRKHGGSLWFETQEGEGTTFFVRLQA